MSPWISRRFLRNQSDERLLAAAASGHVRAFEMLVERHRGSLLAYARGILGPTRAEDALQQGLLQAWVALQRGDEVRNARGWLFRVIRNAAVDIARSPRPEQAELHDSVRARGDVEADVEMAQQVRETLAGVAALPQVQRDALVGTALAGHSHERVGSALGVSAAAVRGLVYRARTNLRAGASALVPSPLLAWFAAVHRRCASLRLTGTGQAGGQALLERGAAVISAGALVAGVAAARHQIGRSTQGDRPQAALALPNGARGHAPAANARSDGSTATASTATEAGAGTGSGSRGAAGGSPGGRAVVPPLERSEGRGGGSAEGDTSSSGGSEQTGSHGDPGSRGGMDLHERGDGEGMSQSHGGSGGSGSGEDPASAEGASGSNSGSGANDGAGAAAGSHGESDGTDGSGGASKGSGDSGMSGGPGPSGMSGGPGDSGSGKGPSDGDSGGSQQSAVTAPGGSNSASAGALDGSREGSSGG
jgi:RNA polymerase sigma factor (sigma-70 family)